MSWIRLLPRARAVGFAPLVSALLACDPQVQSDFPGEPVTSLRGVVSAPASLEVDYDVTAAIVWVRYEPNDDHRSVSRYATSACRSSLASNVGGIRLPGLMF